jgi:extradiol dioxygenase family protein
VLLWGHQITLQRLPDEVLSPPAQGKRHFGVILPWAEWEALGARLLAQGVPLLSPPAVTKVGTPQEQGKIYLADPSHNVIEIKTYRSLSATIGYEGE